MVRSIPPKTMSSLQRERSRAPRFNGSNIRISFPSIQRKSFSQEAPSSFQGKVYKKPRQWQYITKPFFKRIKEPVVDVFKEAEEVQIIIDLGNFRKGELNYGLTGRNYIIFGKHKDCEFREEIPLPYEIDIKKIKEIFRNDILEIIIPKKNTKKTEKQK